MDTEITFISEDLAFKLHRLGYKIGRLFKRPDDEAYLKAEYSAEDGVEEFEYSRDHYIAMGYVDESWFINTDIYSAGGLHLTFADGSNPFVSYYMHGKTIINMLNTLDEYLQNYSILNTYVNNGILYAYLDPKHVKMQEAFV